MATIEPARNEWPRGHDSRGPDDAETNIFRRLSPGLVAFSEAGANVCMQLANPAVGYGVLESRVEGGRGDRHPIKRARTTVTYLSVALFGDATDRAIYKAAIDEQHRQVRSTESSPLKYNAFDPQLQLWFAACLYRGAIDVIEAVYGTMDDATRARVLERGPRLATTLQVRPEMWPATQAEFDEYWHAQVAQIRVDPPVRDYMLATLRLAPFPWIIRRPFGGLSYFLNVGWLPAEFRTAYGLSWTALRVFPFNLLLWDMRLRVSTGQRLV